MAEYKKRCTCNATGKTIYPTKGEANFAMNRFKNIGKHYDITGKRVKRRVKKAEQKRAYYCTHCQGYHLTKWETYKKEQYK